jgi:hypothetical protein
VIKGVGEPVEANNHSSYITHQKSADILVEAVELYSSYRTEEN